jgi:hypothetical protein
MLEQAYKPLKKNINSVIMKSKKLKASLASYSSSNDDDKWRLFTKAINSSPTTRTITSVQRDSIFVKIQRGKIDAEKVIVLKKSLSEWLKLCMSKLYS